MLVLATSGGGGGSYCWAAQRTVLFRQHYLRLPGLLVLEIYLVATNLNARGDFKILHCIGILYNDRKLFIFFFSVEHLTIVLMVEQESGYFFNKKQLVIDNPCSQ